MLRTVEDVVQEWEVESAITGRVLERLTDESLTQTIAVNRRSLGQLAWHLVRTINFMTTTGLAFDEPLAEEEAPASAVEIAREYERLAQSLLRAVKGQWTDASLTETVNILGENWVNGVTIQFFLRHEIHHRGQMTVLMRQAGLNVPDVLGPTREDWIAKGMVPHA